MDRTAEFTKYVEQEHQNPFQREVPFYENLFSKLEFQQRQLSSCNSYSKVLEIESRCNALSFEIHSLFGQITIEGGSQEADYFEGIKAVMEKRLAHVAALISLKKTELVTTRIELEPEAPTVFHATKQADSQDYGRFEQEQKKLVKKYVDTHLQETKRKLLEIQDMQETIGLHLDAQNERIESVIGMVGESKTLVSKGNEYAILTDESSVRRIIGLFFIIMSFVLLFLHFNYK